MLRPALLVAALAVFAACSAPDSTLPSDEGPPLPEQPGPTGEPAARSPELDAARERWAAAGYDAYQMTLHRSCFCPEDYRGPFEVTVQDGAVVEATFNGAPMDTERVLTVDDLFALIEDAYSRDAEMVSVDYDPETGVPTRIQIDYSSQMVDEEVGYTVSDLSAVER